jgi:hypothetical protein
LCGAEGGNPSTIINGVECGEIEDVAYWERLA